MANHQPSEIEKIAGKRASYRVYYRRNGKLYFDAMWAPGVDEAKTKFERIARELRMRFEFVKVERIDCA